MKKSREQMLSQFCFGEPQSVINERFQNAFIELNAMVGALVCLCLNRGVFTVEEFNKLRVRTTAGIDQAIAKQQDEAQKEMLEKLKNDPVARMYMDVFGSLMDKNESFDDLEIYKKPEQTAEQEEIEEEPKELEKIEEEFIDPLLDRLAELNDDGDPQQEDQ